MKHILIIICTLISIFAYTQDFVSIEHVSMEGINNDKATTNSFIYYRPKNVFEDPALFQKTFSAKLIPIVYYTEEEIKLQNALNAKEEGIVTFSEGDDRFFERKIDREAITPYTWKWVHLQVKEDDGSYTNIHLRRPNWWFVKNNATKPGDNVQINIPQIGLDKEVSIIKIYPNQLDTRLWDLQEDGDNVVRPITGKVEHYVNNVVYLTFEEDLENPLSVTLNHLLWSKDRDAWVKVEELIIGEKITTKQEVVTVRERIDREGWYIVYDIEVYRDHNFLVGAQHVLAHNGCKKTGTTSNGFYEVIKDGDVDYAGKGAAGRSKTSKKAKKGDKVIHYEITEGIGDLNLKDTAEIMEHKLGELRSPTGTFTDLPSNKVNSPGLKKYNNLSKEMKEKVDKAFDQVLSKGGTEY